MCSTAADRAASCVRVLGPARLASADYRGNQQHIDTGYLIKNPLCQPILIDHLDQ